LIECNFNNRPIINFFIAMKTKKFLFYTFLILVSVFQAHSQAPTKIWDKTFGGNNTQFAQSIAYTTDGGYVVVGYSSSNISGDKSEDSEGGEDYWIVKMNSAGQKVWDRTIGGSADDFARSVAATYDGGCIVVGTSSSDISGSKSDDSQGLEDYWVVKLDSDGNVEWDRTIGGDDEDKATSIIELSDGSFAIAGYSKSGISGNKTQANIGNEDYWIVKISISGTIQWNKTFGGDLFDYATSLTTNFDGTIAVAGYSYSGISGNKTEASRGQYDYWVIKIDASGNLLWNKTLGGDLFDFANSISKTNDGGYVVAGYTSSGLSGDKTQASKGGYDYWIVKLNSSGTIAWNRTIGGSLDDFAFSIVNIPTSDGGYVLGGSSSSGISGDKSEANKGGSDYWILKLDSGGFKEWDKDIGGSQNDDFAKLFVTTDGRYLLSGTSNSPVSGDKLEANKGTKDYWVVKLQSCPIVNPPYALSQTICYGTSASLSATCSTGTPTWYDNTTTIFISSGSPINTPNLTTNTNYQVRCETGGIPNCMSPFSNVTVFVNPIVVAPTINNVSINQNTSTTLTAGCISSTPNWYNAGGTLLGTGTYITPVLSATTTYYVACETGGTPNCVSATRTPQTVTTVCPNALTPTGTITTNQKAATTVITVAGTSGAGTLNIIPNAANVVYQAGKFIKLNPGFVANKTSVFTAKILAGCL
jgi:Ig-like domain CHU_C associated